MASVGTYADQNAPVKGYEREDEKHEARLDFTHDDSDAKGAAQRMAWLTQSFHAPGAGAQRPSSNASRNRHSRRA